MALDVQNSLQFLSRETARKGGKHSQGIYENLKVY